ncbi:hypothetical protein ACPV5S_15480, partial [Vibrio astriarenae]
PNRQDTTMNQSVVTPINTRQKEDELRAQIQSRAEQTAAEVILETLFSEHGDTEANEFMRQYGSARTEQLIAGAKTLHELGMGDQVETLSKLITARVMHDFALVAHSLFGMMTETGMSAELEEDFTHFRGNTEGPVSIRIDLNLSPIEI